MLRLAHEGVCLGQAMLSADGIFRYRLHRCWGDGTRLVWLMLNPSKATAQVNDPTIVSVMDFSRRHGYDGVEVGNLFAFRATDPRDLRRAGYPIGPENDGWIEALVESAVEAGSDVVVAWGALAHGLARVDEVLRIVRGAGVWPLCLGTTRAGLPRHPLYVPRSRRLTIYGGA